MTNFPPSLQRFMLTMTFIILSVSLSYSQTQEYETVSYRDNCGISPEKMTELIEQYKLKSSETNLSSMQISQSEMPEVVQKSLEHALTIWEMYIPEVRDLNIDIFYEPSDVALVSDVRYSIDLHENYYIPSFLYDVKYNIESSAKDGSLTINSLLLWEAENTSSINNTLTKHLIHAIGRFLGFGSSVTINSNTGLYYFSERRKHTLFDTLVVADNGARLSDIPATSRNSDLTDFVNEEGRSFFIEFEDSRVQLSNEFNDIDMPFTLLTSGIMSSAFDYDGSYECIDDDVLNVLQFLGWEVNRKPIKIAITPIQTTGNASIFDIQELTISDSIGRMTDKEYVAKFRTSDGPIEKIFTDTDDFLSLLPTLDNLDDFVINQDNTISVDISIRGILNGQEYTSNPIGLKFDICPIIENLEITEISSSAPNSYDAYFSIKYKGTSKLIVSLDEEYGGMMREWYFYDPYGVDDVVPNIMSHFSAWIDFYLLNKYVTIKKTVELGPYGSIIDIYSSGSEVSIPSHTTGLDKNFSNEQEYCKVYDTMGRLVWSGENTKDFLSSGVKGSFIVVVFGNGKAIKTEKIIL